MNEQKENCILGIIGAIIGIIPGIIAWVAIDQFGFIAGIAGWLMMAGALQGYALLGHNLSKLGVIVAIIFTMMAVVLSEYIGIMVTVYTEYIGMGTNMANIRPLVILPEILSDKSVQIEIAKNIVIGLIFIVISCYIRVHNTFKGVA